MKLEKEKNTYYVRGLSNTLKTISSNSFTQYQSENKEHTHFCDNADICFTDASLIDKKVIAAFDGKRKQIHHVHFKKSFVTIDRYMSQNFSEIEMKWYNYTLSKLEFLLRFPQLIKKFEAEKDEENVKQ